MTIFVWFPEVGTGGCLEKREIQNKLYSSTQLFLTIVVVIFPLVDQGVGDLATSYSLNVLNTEAAVRRCSSK